MEAVVIAGGLGSRLLPLTEHRPKHLLPVGGVPFVVHQLAKLASAGVEHVVLATSYRADAFLPVLGDGSSLGIRISYAREEEPLGTGGAIRHVAKLLASEPDAPVIVLNGDILSGHHLSRQIRAWRATDADVCLHLVEVPDPRAFGCVPTAPDGRVLAFREKSPDPPSRQVNAGCYVFARRVIDTIPAGRLVSVERETFPALVADGLAVYGHLDNSYWADVGTPAALVRASADLVRGIASSAAYTSPPAEQLLQTGARVAESAHIDGGTVIGSGAVVAAKAVVSGSVLMPGARVGAGATVVDSVLGYEAEVGRGSALQAGVLGDGAVLPARGDQAPLGSSASE